MTSNDWVPLTDLAPLPHTNKSAKMAAVLIAAISIGHAGTAAAVDLSYQMGGRYEASDNIALAPMNEVSDHLRELFFNVQLDEDKPLYDYNIIYFLRGRDYRDDVLQDQNLVSGRALATWKAIPERFNWNVVHLRGDLLRDRQLANNDNNREIRNTFSTGPDFKFRVGSVDELELRLRYTDIRFETSEDADNDRLSANLFWQRELGPVSNFSFGLGHDEVEYDNGAEQEFSQVSVQYQANVRLGNYSIRLGYNEAETLRGDDADGLLARVQFRYNINSHNVSLLYTRQLADTAIGLIENQIANPIITDAFGLEDGTDANFAEIDVVTFENTSLAWSTDSLCARCSVEATLLYNQLDFETLNRDEVVRGANTAFTYNVSRRVNATLIASYNENRLVNRTDDVTIYGLNFEYQPLPNLQLRLGFAEETRDSNQNGFGYEELSTEFTFIWFFGFNSPG